MLIKLFKISQIDLFFLLMSINQDNIVSNSYIKGNYILPFFVICGMLLHAAL